MEARLIVRHFGSIKDLDIVIKPLTIFIGDQGTGKSTIAKLYSTFRWLEKALLQGRWTVTRLSQYNRFQNVICAYSRLNNFFCDDTFISFYGQNYDFTYAHRRLEITEKETQYNIAKIMYVPAERSILSVMDTSAKILKGMPDTLAEFNDTLVEAKAFYSKGFTLPFAPLEYVYDKSNGISWIKKHNDYRIRLTEASSGIQSSLPLCLVTEYLSQLVNDQSDRQLSLDEQKRLKNEVTKIMEGNYSESVKNAMLENISNYGHYGSFVNIVEELELNLFPKSQVEVLHFLIRHLNQNPSNELLLTTHSPYILSALNISLLAAKVTMQGQSTETIIPKECQIASERVAAYSLETDGEAYCVSILSGKTGMVSANYLDTVSSSLSEEFDQLYHLYISAMKHGTKND